MSVIHADVRNGPMLRNTVAFSTSASAGSPWKLVAGNSQIVAITKHDQYPSHAVALGFS